MHWKTLPWRWPGGSSTLLQVWWVSCSVLLVLVAPVTFWLYLLERTHQAAYWFTVQHVGYGRARSPLPSTVWSTVGMVRHGLWFVQYQAALELLEVAMSRVSRIPEPEALLDAAIDAHVSLVALER